MVNTRTRRTALQPVMKDAGEFLPAAALLIGNALLTLAKYRTPA